MPELNFQKWRAIASFSNKSNMLLFLGPNSLNVKQNYQRSYSWLVSEEQAKLRPKITLQRWQGRSDVGNWVDVEPLPYPE